MENQNLSMTLIWKKILKTFDDNNTGCIIQVDIHFLIELHDNFQEFILASETLTPDLEWRSDYQQEIGQTTGIIKNIEFIGSGKCFLICLSIINVSFMIGV